MVILVIAIVALALMAFRGLVLMWLWNWLMPAILGLPEISFWQSVGLFLLTSFLFGNILDKNMVPKKSEK